MQHSASKGWVLQGFLEQHLLGFSLGHHALGSVSDTTSVVLRGDGGREDVLVRVHGFGKNVVPLAKPNHHVPRHGDVGFKENGAHWDDASQHELNTVVGVAGWKGINRLASVLEGRLVLSVKHGTPHHEVVVVHAVKLVELRFVSGDVDVMVVGFNRSDVALNGFLPLANPCIDVGGHVDQVPEAGHACAKDISGEQGFLGERGKFQSVAVQVAKRWVDSSSLTAFKGVFHDLDEKQGVLVGRRNLTGSGVLVPQLPRLEVHQSLNVGGGDGEVACVLLVKGSHGFGESDVELGGVAHVEHGRVGSVACLGGVSLGEGTDQVLLEFAAVVHDAKGLLYGIITRAQTRSPVVVGRKAVGDAPVGHGAVWVNLSTGRETSDGLLVVVIEVVAIGFNEQPACFI